MSLSLYSVAIVDDVENWRLYKWVGLLLRGSFCDEERQQRQVPFPERQQRGLHLQHEGDEVDVSVE
jgi:hypothetical protein